MKNSDDFVYRTSADWWGIFWVFCSVILCSIPYAIGFVSLLFTWITGIGSYENNWALLLNDWIMNSNIYPIQILWIMAVLFFITIPVCVFIGNPDAASEGAMEGMNKK